LLTSWGVEFDPINTEGNPEGQAELKALGVPRPPAVAFNGRAVHGWNPEGYAELLGIKLPDKVRLSPPDLAARLDRILATTEALLHRFDAAAFAWKPPERDRSVGNLGYHVFRVGLSFIDSVDGDGLKEGWFGERAPAEITDGPALARYGALVRARLSGWFAGASGDEFTRVLKTYYGPQGAHELLERTTWHAGQHLRQLYDLAARLNIKPPAPLPSDIFADLPMPESVW
jgi:hypothetical protein